jgi:hypothetical protein
MWLRLRLEERSVGQVGSAKSAAEELEAQAQADLGTTITKGNKVS